MANFKKSGSSSRHNDTFRHGESQSLVRVDQTEQRIANSVIQDKLEVKDTPLSRMTALKTTVLYFQQKIDGRNDYISNTANLGTTDVNKMAFYKIKDFVIICQDALNVSVESNDGNTSLMGDGSAKILPKTIKPRVNDHFIMTTLEKKNLYRVINVTKSSIEDDSAYEIQYQLVEENSEEKLTELNRLVVDTYTFIYTHVGTSFRTLFREDEYEALDSLEAMYIRMSELFNEYFYDDDKNTYIFTYDALTIKNEDGISIEEARRETKPFTQIIANRSGDSTTIVKPVLNESDSWYGSKMYDRFLVEFMQRNTLFSNVEGKIYYVKQLEKDIEKWYSKTVWYALEHQASNRIAFRYFIPAPITRVSIATTISLHGIVSLEPSPEFTSMSISLMPEALTRYMMLGDEMFRDRSMKDVMLNTYSSMVELICETIGLYVNRHEDMILDRLRLLAEHLDEFSELSIRDQNMFYLFPMLAYVTRKCMDRLSDVNFGLSMYGE